MKSKQQEHTPGKWQRLATVGPPEKWQEMYSHYQELLQREDVAAWYSEQFNIANADRQQLSTALAAERERNRLLVEALEKIVMPIDMVVTLTPAGSVKDKAFYIQKIIRQAIENNKTE